MAKETHIKTDKKTVGGWGAWELRLILYKKSQGLIWRLFWVFTAVHWTRAKLAHITTGRTLAMHKRTMLDVTLFRHRN
jgi:hypothetical protein